MADDKYGTVVYVPPRHGVYVFPLDSDDGDEDA